MESAFGPLPLSAALVITVVTLIAEHYALRDRELHVVARYVAGVLAHVAPFTWWAIGAGYAEPVGALWLLFGVGGLTVASLYALGAYVATRQEAEIQTDRAEHLLHRMTGGDDGDAPFLRPAPPIPLRSNGS